MDLDERLRRPGSVEGLVDCSRRATGGDHSGWDDYRAATLREQRVPIQVEPTRGPDRSG
jgi:hypothetical protein